MRYSVFQDKGQGKIKQQHGMHDSPQECINQSINQSINQYLFIVWYDTSNIPADNYAFGIYITC